MKNALIVAGVMIIVVAGGVSYFLYGPDNFLGTPSPTTVVNQASPTTVQFREIARGQTSTVKERKNYFITSSAQLSELWKMAGRTDSRPTIDFTKDDVIAVFMGEEPTAGYTIGVKTIEDTQNRMVTVSLTKPGISCANAEMITAPYHIIVVPKTDLPLSHTDVVTTISCL